MSKARKTEIDLGTMVYGKIPPQAKDLEEAVLGVILLEKDAFDIVIQYLQPNRFYVKAHGIIFKAMISLANKSQPIDSFTLAEELNKMGSLEIVGGPYYLSKLTNSVVSSAHTEFHCKIVVEKWIQREVIRVAGQMIEQAYEGAGDAFALLDEVEGEIYSISDSFNINKGTTIDTLLVEALQELEKIRQTPDRLTGVTSGFFSIDKITHGWQPTDLIILAARPGVGKTAFALNIAKNAAMNPVKPVPTALFSLEMSSKQLIQRLLACESEILLDKIRKGRVEDAEMKIIFTRAINPLSKAPLIIDDTPALNIFELRAKCRRLKAKQNIGLIIIDYLQLMSGTGQSKQRNRENEISEISRGLKNLAKELNVPIIALSQLSRETEKRSDKQPQLSDLRESGAIEQDADAVVFIYRPEYYGNTVDAMGESNPGETIFRFAKYRNGAPGTARLRANLSIQRFSEMDAVLGGWKPVIPSDRTGQVGTDQLGSSEDWYK